MADDIKIGLDGKPLVDAVKPALESLIKLKAELNKFGDEKGISRLNRETQGLLSSVKQLAASAEGEMSKFASGVAAGVAKAGREAKAKAKAAGREVGKEFANAVEQEASKAKVSVSASRISGSNGLGISVSGKGLGAQADVLAAQRDIMNSTGGMTSVQIKQWDDAQKAIDAGRVAAAGRSRLLADGLASDSIREEVRRQTDSAAAKRAVGKLAAGAQSDNLREELRHQTDRAAATQAVAKVNAGAQSDSVREELRHQAERVTAAKATQTLRNGLAADAIREETRRQSEMVKSATAQSKLAEGATLDRLRESERRISEELIARQERMRVLGRTAAAQYNVAARAPVGEFSATSGVRAGIVTAPVTGDGGVASLERAKAAKLAGAAASKELAAAEQKLTRYSNDLHSASRGLASGFNAMWLTWGTLAPLLAGAAISNAFTSAIKKGAEFGQTLAVIQNLAEQTTPQMREVNTAILDIGKGGSAVGPLELAGALKTLALAGLTATEQIQALKPTLNFSIAGEVPIKEAAETLVSVSTAFGYTAKDFSVVGDIIAKTAAVSMSSVADMSSSFRVASAVAQQYNVSLVDAATSLALLSQIGIKGTAAGTAMRQMYSELLGSSKKSRQLLKETLGVEMFDNATNSMKPLVTIMSDLSGALDKLNPKSQQLALMSMGNERGTKALLANLTAYRTEVGKTGEASEGATTGLRKMQAAIEEAPAFTAQAAIAMSLTALNQMKAVGNTLETVLIEAFQKVEPSVILVSRALREALASPDFQSGINSILTSVMSLVTTLVEHGSQLVTVAKLYLVYQAASIGATLATTAAGVAFRVLGVTAATTAVGVIGTTTALATVAPVAATAAVGLVALNRAFGIIGLVVSAAAAAYYLFAETKKASDTDSMALSKVMAKESIDQMNKETERLEKTMELRNSGMAEQQIAAAVAHSAARQAIVDNGEQAASVLQLAVTESELVRTRVLANNPNRKGPALAALDTEIGEQKLAVERARLSAAAELDKYDTAYKNMRTAAIKDAQQATAAAQARRPVVKGAGVFDPDAKTVGKGAARREADAEYKNQLKLIDLTIAAAKKAAGVTDEEGRINEARVTMRHARGLSTEKEFQDALTALQNDQTATRVQMAQDEITALSPLLAELKARAAILKAKGGAGVPERLQNDLDATQQKVDDATQTIVKLRNDKEIRLGQVLTDALKPATELLKHAEKEGALDQEKINAEIEKLRLKGSGLELTDREQFIQEEILRILGKQREELVAAQLVMKQKVSDGTYGPAAGNDAQESQRRLQAEIDRKQAALADGTARLRPAAGSAFDGKQWESTADKLSSSVEGSIKDGLNAALTGDMSSLANFGKTLQKTVTGALVDAFYSAFVKDSVKQLSSTLMSSLREAILGASAAKSGVNVLGTVLSLAGAYTGGGGITSAAGTIGSGNAASIAAANYGTGTIPSTFGRFSEGGFTGSGANSDVAGFVHANEFVINAKNTAKYPKSFLDSLNGYADGGLVQSLSGPSLSSPAGRISEPGGGGLTFAPVTSISVDSRSDRAAVIQDVNRVIAENNKQYTEALKRMKVIPG